MKVSTYWKTCVQTLSGLAVTLLPLCAHSGSLTGTIAPFLYYRPTPTLIFVYTGVRSIKIASGMLLCRRDVPPHSD